MGGGGWAVEAFSGVHRKHHDVDVAIFKYDVPALLDLVGDRYDVWSVSSGSFVRSTRRGPSLPGKRARCGCASTHQRPG